MSRREPKGAKRPHAAPVEVRVVEPDRDDPDAFDRLARALARLLDTPPQQVG